MSRSVLEQPPRALADRSPITVGSWDIRDRWACRGPCRTQHCAHWWCDVHVQWRGHCLVIWCFDHQVGQLWRGWCGTTSTGSGAMTHVARLDRHCWLHVWHRRGGGNSGACHRRFFVWLCRHCRVRRPVVICSSDQAQPPSRLRQRHISIGGVGGAVTGGAHAGRPRLSTSLELGAAGASGGVAFSCSCPPETGTGGAISSVGSGTVALTIKSANSLAVRCSCRWIWGAHL